MVSKEIMNCTVVIRSASERTSDSCEKLVRKELPTSVSITKIELKPFEATLRKSYEIGLESGKEFLITIDADVLPRPGALGDLLSYIKKTPENVLQLEGYLFDGILLKYRKGGVKLYRAVHLDKALGHIPAYGHSIRPESYTLRKMKAAGYPSKNVYIVAGIHDFGQYKRDLYRKSYIHAIKHPKEVSETLPRWAELSKSNSDYLIVMQGVFDGLLDEGDVKIDTRDFIKSSQNALNKMNLSENQPIKDVIITENLVKEILSSCEPLFPPVSIQKLKFNIRKKGLGSTINHIISSALFIAAKKLSTQD